MTVDLSLLFSVASPIVAGIVGWWAKTIADELRLVKADLKSTQASLDAHKLFAAETYLRDADFAKLRDELIGHFERLERLVNTALGARANHPPGE
jgi:hypothetical protein